MVSVAGIAGIGHFWWTAANRAPSDMTSGSCMMGLLGLLPQGNFMVVIY